MMVLGIILLVILLFLILLLLMPLRLHISSRGRFIYLGIPPVLSGRICWNQEDLRVGISIVFWRKNWGIADLAKVGENRLGKKEKKKLERPKKTSDKKKKQKPRIPKFFIRKLKKNWLRLIRSFRVKAFYLDVDSGDYVINAYLYPIFLWLAQSWGRPVRINFWGENHVEVNLVNRSIYVLWAFLS